MKVLVRKFYSEAAKRKAEESAQLLKLELLNSNKVPRLSVEHQTGGAASTRGRKREISEEESKNNVKAPKPEDEDSTPTTSDEYGGGSDPLFQANIDKMGRPKNWKKRKVIDQKFTFSLEQRREATPDKDLGVGAVHALTVGMDTMIDDMKIDPTKYELAFETGSKERFKEASLTGEKWPLPADDCYQRLQRTQSMLNHIANVLNSGEFISSDRGFSASMTLIRSDVKGRKHGNYKPGTKI